MKKLVTPIIAAALLSTASPVFADYTVQSGDTLSQIAVNNHITLTDLERLNPQLKDPNWIYVNDVIKTNSTPDVASPPTQVKTQPKYSAHDLDLLSRLVEAEAGGEPYEGKIAVAETVMNRVASNIFPNTIQGVIYEPHQFSPVSNGMIYRPASNDSIRAAKEVLSTYTADPNGTLYYYAPSKTSNNWIRTRQVVKQIGNQVFSK
jgi:N-acetylmuramoyl-L-alanine amidase